MAAKKFKESKIKSKNNTINKDLEDEYNPDNIVNNEIMEEDEKDENEELEEDIEEDEDLDHDENNEDLEQELEEDLGEDLEEKLPLNKEELQEFKNKVEKTGVVYISRIPPRLKPHKLKQLLSIYKVKIGRVYFSPEDERTRLKRKRSGGSSQKFYTEGWIEFLDKSKAKSLVKMINNTPMNPKKHSFHHEDIWNLKYLPKFKWHHLTERIAYEREVRNQRLRAEINAAKKLNQQYIEKVEQKKKIQGMEKKKKESGKPLPEAKIIRQFHQRELMDKEVKQDNIKSKKVKKQTKKGEDDLDKVLDSIF